MSDQTQRLEIATVRAEIGSNITYRFNNDAIDADEIPTDSGPITNLKKIIKSVEDKASISTSIYPDVSQGLAATDEGGMFLVASTGEDEIYIVWRKVSGAAVDTGKRALSSEVVKSAADSARSSAESSAASALLAQEAASSAAGEVGVVYEQLADETDPAKGGDLVGYKAGYSVKKWLKALEDSQDPEKGARLMGYLGRSVSDKLEERIDVTDHWLAIDADWSNAIDRCVVKATAVLDAGAQPDRAPIIWFPQLKAPWSGAYAISRTVHSTLPMRFDGDGVRIYALPGFTGKTVPLFGGGTAVDKSMFLFLNGLRGDLAGLVRHGPRMGKGLVLDGQDNVDRNIYIERMPYAELDSACQFSAQDGIVIGPNNWGMSMMNTVIGNFTRYGIYVLYNAALNGSRFHNIRVWGEFKEGEAGIVVGYDAECNGLVISGFIEKLQRGLVVSGGNGPILLQGVDFEFTRLGCVRVVGDPSKPRVGPITLQNCFLHSTEYTKVYADHAVVAVDGCRSLGGMYDVGTEGLGRGLITVHNHINVSAGVFTVAPGSAVKVEDETPTTSIIRNYKHQKESAFVPAWELRNYQYRDSPELQSSGLSFLSYYVGGAEGQYVSVSDWWVSEYQHASSPGVLTRRVGVRLANDAGQNLFQPIISGITGCGGPGASWSGGSTVVAFTVTSDIRHKTEIREIIEAENRVAMRCKGMMRAFRLLDEVDREGDAAGIHVGVIAQDVCQAFEDEGLDWKKYKIVERGEWDAREEEVNDEGQIMLPRREAGHVYSVRYEQLLAFIIAAM